MRGMQGGGGMGGGMPGGIPGGVYGDMYGGMPGGMAAVQGDAATTRGGGVGENRHYWPGGIECGVDDGKGGVSFRAGGAFKGKNGGGSWVAESHLVEDLLTEFTHPKFHVGRVVELFAEIEAAAEDQQAKLAAAGTTRKTKKKKKKK